MKIEVNGKIIVAVLIVLLFTMVRAQVGPTPTCPKCDMETGITKGIHMCDELLAYEVYENCQVANDDMLIVDCLPIMQKAEEVMRNATMMEKYVRVSQLDDGVYTCDNGFCDVRP